MTQPLIPEVKSDIQRLSPRTKICVFCGGNDGIDPGHKEAAHKLAIVMAEHDIDLGDLLSCSLSTIPLVTKHQAVYGGGTVGLMGTIARTLCSIKGPDSVHGIIPEALLKLERSNLTTTALVPDVAEYGRTTVVKDMHTRKKLMADEILSAGPGSGFIALSGGFGTVEELFEMTTWNQLGIQGRGVCLLNINGYWDGILQWLDKAVLQGFIKPDHRAILVSVDTSAEAVKVLNEHQTSGAVDKMDWT